MIKLGAPSTLLTALALSLLSASAAQAKRTCDPTHSKAVVGSSFARVYGKGGKAYVCQRIVRAHARLLVRQHRGELARMLALYGLAAVAALVPAWIIGRLINDAVAHHLTSTRSAWSSPAFSVRRSPTRGSPSSRAGAATCSASASSPNCARSSSPASWPCPSRSSSAPAPATC